MKQKFLSQKLGKLVSFLLHNHHQEKLYVQWNTLRVPPLNAFIQRNHVLFY